MDFFANYAANPAILATCLEIYRKQTKVSIKEALQMIHRWSESIAGRLASAGIIQDKKAVYAYGLELLFSSLFSTGAIILISMLARRPFHWLFFSAGFIPLRLTAGGYHASSHMKCVLTTAAAFSVSLFGANVIGNRLSIFQI